MGLRKRIVSRPLDQKIHSSSQRRFEKKKRYSILEKTKRRPSLILLMNRRNLIRTTDKDRDHTFHPFRDRVLEVFFHERRKERRRFVTYLWIFHLSCPVFACLWAFTGAISGTSAESESREGP